MPKFHVKKGDHVVVLAGKEKGKSGKIIAVLAKQSRVKVEGLQLVKKAVRKSQTHPNGALIDQEGIVYAEIDLNACIQPKQMHDIIGAYNRFDIFDLRIDRRPRPGATFRDQDDLPNEVDETTSASTANTNL